MDDATTDGRGAGSSTLKARIAGAALPSLAALFLGAITLGVLGAEVSGPPILGVVLRGFFGLVVGGIAVGLAAVAVRVLFGAQPGAAGSGAPLPEAIRALCPACGRPASDAHWCPSCELPLAGRTVGWCPEERSRAVNLFLVCLGVGLLSLGVGIAAGPGLEGERRLWAMLAAFALGLLVAGFGAILAWGGAAVLLDDLRGITRWSYRFELRVAGASYSVSGSAVGARKGLAHAHGSATMAFALDALHGVRKPETVDAAQHAFARALAVLHAEGHVSLWWRRETRWSIGAPVEVPWFRRAASAPADAEVEGSVEQQLMMQFLTARLDAAARPLLEVLAPMARGATPVAALWRTFREAGADPARLACRREPPAGEEADLQLAERAVAAEIGRPLLN